VAVGGEWDASPRSGGADDHDAGMDRHVAAGAAATAPAAAAAERAAGRCTGCGADGAQRPRAGRAAVTLAVEAAAAAAAAATAAATATAEGSVTRVAAAEAERIGRPPRSRRGTRRVGAVSRVALTLAVLVGVAAAVARPAAAGPSADRFWDHETEMPIRGFSFSAFGRLSGSDGPGMVLGDMAWSTTGKGGTAGTEWTYTMPSNASVTIMPDKASTWKRRVEWSVTAHSADAFDGHDLVGAKFYVKMALHIPFVWHSRLRAGVRAPARIARKDDEEAEWVHGFLIGLVDDMVVNIAGVEGTVFCSDTVRHRSGLCNNERQPRWGSTNAALRRLGRGLDPAYADGKSAPSGADRPSAREVSNAMCGERNGSAAGNRHRHTELLTFFGQLLDHDVGHTPTGNAKSNLLFNEALDIPVDKDDYLYFKVRAAGTRLKMTRSVYERRHGSTTAVRSQPNRLTSYLDGSVLYGSDGYRWHCLREKRAGRLRLMGDAQLLPKNRVADLGLTVENSPSSGPEFFVSGDVRSNENVVLLAMHHVFAREHNRLADAVGAARPDWDDVKVFESARMLVAAKLQQVTYNEWLPCLLGTDGLPAYTGYKKEVDATLSAFFTTAAFRLGHTLVNKEITRLGPGNEPLAGGAVSLKKGLFNPSFFEETGPDPFLRGSANTRASALDLSVVDGLRNFLFTDVPGEGGFDLVALNLQRARDHAIPDYNAARAAYGLPRKPSFAAITADADLADRMDALYGGRVDNVDAFIGMLAEDAVAGSAVGELLHTALTDEFARLRDGDRFFYKNVRWPKELRAAVPSELAALDGDRVTMRQLLLDNTGIAAKDLPAGNAFCPKELRR